jgi:hypothetical protein
MVPFQGRVYLCIARRQEEHSAFFKQPLAMEEHVLVEYGSHSVTGLVQ